MASLVGHDAAHKRVVHLLYMHHIHLYGGTFSAFFARVFVGACCFDHMLGSTNVNGALRSE